MTVVYLDESEIEIESETGREFVRVPKQIKRKLNHEVNQ